MEVNGIKIPTKEELIQSFKQIKNSIPKDRRKEFEKYVKNFDTSNPIFLGLVSMMLRNKTKTE